eukprot:8248056-Prorocentrum_lima.AAC.1
MASSAASRSTSDSAGMAATLPTCPRMYATSCRMRSLSSRFCSALVNASTAAWRLSADASADDAKVRRRNAACVRLPTGSD